MKSNQRFILNLLLIAAIAASLCACDDTVGFGGFEVLCSQSGGTYKGGKCICKNDNGKDDACDEGVICNVETKGCASSKPDPTASKACSVEDETICLDGKYRTCKDGTWGELTPCTSDPDRRKMCDGNKCGECFENEFKCEGNERQQCIGGKWTNKEKCEYGCADDKFTCAPKCDVNKCVNNEDENKKMHGKMTECKDNRAVTSTCENKATSEPVSCNAAGSGCGECLNGNIKCNDGKTAKCMDGKWAESTDCPNHFSCKSATECGECQDGKVKECKDSQLTTCDGGKWETDSCPGGSSCKSATECGECKDGETKCKDGEITECKDGTWSVPKACDQNVSCKSATECGECRNDAVKCETDKGVHTLSTCKDGKWKGEPCPGDEFCDSNKTKCIECTKGKCNNNITPATFTACSAGKWQPVQSCGNKACINTTEKLGCDD